MKIHSYSMIILIIMKLKENTETNSGAGHHLGNLAAMPFFLNDDEFFGSHKFF